MGRKVLIFSICWCQWYKCSHLANFKLSMWHPELHHCGVGNNVHNCLSWAKASWLQHTIAWGPVSPQICWVRPLGLEPRDMSFSKSSRWLWTSCKFAKHWSVMMGVSRLLGFLQCWKCSQWEYTKEHLCWVHRLSHAKGVSGSVLQSGNLSVQSTGFKAERQSPCNLHEEKAATEATKIWKKSGICH